MQTKLRHLITGRTLEVSFHPGESVQEADLERVKANFLYRDHQGSHFMDNVNFEQFAFSDETLGVKKDYLREGIEVEILKFNNNPINVEIPPKVRLKVTSAPPGVKGDSAGGVTKEIILENGLTVKAPLFIKEGEDVIVNTDTGEYVERAGDNKK